MAKSPNLQGALRELLDLTKTSLDGFQTPPGLRYQVLAAITAAEHEHVSAIVQLSTGLTTGSAEILLRTLLEGWIAAQYVVVDDTDSRAKSYVLNNSYETRKFLRRTGDLARRNPNDESDILRSFGLSSLSDCDERSAEIDKRISDIRQQGITRFPSMEACARAVGLSVERTYTSLYGFLFSERAHVGVRATFHFLLDPNPDTLEARQLHMEKVLLTALALYLDLLKMTAAHLGRPDTQSLAKFDTVLEQARGSDQPR